MSDIVTADTKTKVAETDNGDYVNALVRGLEVIRAFSRTNSRMTLSEVAAETGLTRAAARRFLLTLVRERYAGKDGKYFMLTPKVLELGFSVLASMDITEVIQPIINELAEDIRESVFVTTFDQDSVIYIATGLFPPCGQCRHCDRFAWPRTLPVHRTRVACRTA